VIMAAEGRDNHEIARLLKTSHVTVGLWRQRFLNLGLFGLQDIPKPGRPKALPFKKVQIVLNGANGPVNGPKKWSCRSMAKRSGLSRSTVQRLWAANGIKATCEQQHPPSGIPRLSESLWDMAGAFLLPPALALVLVCDRRESHLTLERIQPELPLGSWNSEILEDNRFWRDAVELFAGLDYVCKKILTESVPRPRNKELSGFLRAVERSIPLHAEIHIILGDSAAHANAPIRDRLAKSSRIRVHLKTPGTSWLNCVEGFILDLKGTKIRRGSFSHLRELISEIWTQLSYNSLKPRQFSWKANLNSN